MRQILAVGIPVLGNFLLWALVSYLPVHATVVFALVIIIGILMIWSMSHFARKGSEGVSTPQIPTSGKIQVAPHGGSPGASS